MTFALGFVLAASSWDCVSKDSSAETATINITMKIGRLNPLEVGVLTPAKKFVFLRSHDFSCEGISLEDGVVSIVPSAATGYYWDSDGKRSEVAVFSEVGAYEIHVGDNLETESDGAATLTKRYSNAHAFAISANGTCKPY